MTKYWKVLKERHPQLLQTVDFDGWYHTTVASIVYIEVEGMFASEDEAVAFIMDNEEKLRGEIVIIQPYYNIEF